jgi:hypothetical protein
VIPGQESQISIKTLAKALDRQKALFTRLVDEFIAGGDLEPITWDALTESHNLVSMLIVFRRQEEMAQRGSK